MKLKILTLIVTFIMMFGLFFNQLIHLEYDVSIFEYIYYSLPPSEDDLEYLQAKSKLIYGGNISEPPLGIMESESGQYMGLVVDYMNAISIQLGVPILSKPMVWNDALEALSQKKTDLCDMVPSVSRSEFYDFSNPLYDLKGALVVKAGTEEEGLAEAIGGKTIAVQKGDYSIEVIRSRYPLVDIVETDNVGDALVLLQNDEVQAVLGDEPVIWYYLNELSVLNQFVFINESVYDQSCSIAVPKGEKELLRSVNRAIFELRKNGTLDKINQKWSGYSLLLNRNTDTEKLKVGIFMITALLGIFLSLIMYGNMKLKSLVQFKTRELQFAFDSLKNFMIVIDENKLITNVNLALVNYLSVRKESLLGKHTYEIDLLNRAMMALANDSNCEFQCEGRLYQVKFEHERMLLISDITYDKIKEQQMIHSNRMEAIGQLASGVAHELRNPLGVIRNSTFLLNDMVTDSDPVVVKSINAINSSVLRASRIIDNLLKFSRFDGVESAEINVIPIIEEILEYFRTTNKNEHISFELICEPSLIFRTNEHSLRHVIINLVSNACDALKGAGEVKITCDLHEEGGIQITVSDNGIGIEPSHLSRLFDPFYTTKAPGEGTGLGLYIVYTELKKINGAIKVESAPECGSTFIITLKEAV
ncbi:MULTISPECIES: ATP-binding protein [unclassified Fusibacter]|uniref:ATP-binding protein n=1 Tax=unclassified Fusibacter TaxID=2624464 RepID=UPI0013E97A59|nr:MULTISPECIES: transporter substrate-binding domain-containing protein [unclassified Fusibacter]MCK8060633.1 transporter substrate-binding domain-containing protein [Fusibacter sp. A2]NPE22913.1 transporter substrate-binding domain-containing protein [Fusibacter sp. A1]